MRKKANAVLAVVALSGLILTGCGSEPTEGPAAVIPADASTLGPGTGAPQVEFDGPSYESVRALADDPDVVVVAGTFGEVVYSGPESKASTDGGVTSEFSIDIFKFSVDSEMKGEASESILVQRLQPSTLGIGATVDSGDQAVLFLYPIGTFDSLPLFAVRGVDQGRVEVEGEAIAASEAASVELAAELESLSSVTELESAVNAVAAQD